MEHRRSSSRSRSRQQPERSFTEKCKDYLRQFLAFLFSNIGIICLVIGYTIAGAFIFIYIEANDHDIYSRNLRTNMSATRNVTITNLWNFTCCQINVFDEYVWRNEVARELKTFQSIVISNVQKGYEGDNYSSNRWSFSGAFLYSLTVITTIGYGNVAPVTVLGKLTTIVYAIAGMPLFLLYLSNIGDILAKSFKWIYAKCCLCRGCPTRPRDLQKTMQNAGLRGYGRRKSAAMNTRRWNVRNGDSEFEDSDMDSSDEAYDSSEEEEEEAEEEETEEEETDTDSSSIVKSDPQMVTVPITLCLTIMVGYIYGGAILFSKWEEWDILDGSYFCFISLSTIGFGDIVPGDKITGTSNGSGFQTLELSFILCAMYLMLGMALIAMCFNLMQEEVVHKMRTCSEVLRRIARCRR